MQSQNLTLPIAFLAGLLSFVSPCVLPLVPAYIGYLGGTAVTAEEWAGTQHEATRTLLHSVLFVLGFMLVFVLLGASATFVGRLMLDYLVLMQRVGGVLLVVFGMRLLAPGWSKRRWALAAAFVALATFVVDSGLLTLGEIEISEYTVVWLEESMLMGLIVLAGAEWSTARQIMLAVCAGILNYLSSFDTAVPKLAASLLITVVTIFLSRADIFYAERKLELKQTAQTGYLRSLLFGVVFAAGWTPCVGPILAGILVIASQLHTVGQGILLLVAYSLGLGIPFLVVALAFGPITKSLRRMNRYLSIVSIVSGVLLVLMGLLIFTGSLTFLAQYSSFVNIEL